MCGDLDSRLFLERERGREEGCASLHALTRTLTHTKRANVYICNVQRNARRLRVLSRRANDIKRPRGEGGRARASATLAALQSILSRARGVPDSPCSAETGSTTGELRSIRRARGDVRIAHHRTRAFFSRIYGPSDPPSVHTRRLPVAANSRACARRCANGRRRKGEGKPGEGEPTIGGGRSLEPVRAWLIGRPIGPFRSIRLD